MQAVLTIDGYPRPSKHARIAIIADPQPVDALERVRSATGSDVGADGSERE